MLDVSLTKMAGGHLWGQAVCLEEVNQVISCMLLSMSTTAERFQQQHESAQIVHM